MLAFWIGSVITDANGHATRRRQAAGVADDLSDHGGGRRSSSRFGSGDAEIRINKPLTLKPTFPRFLAVGDKASFGAVVTSQLKTARHGDRDDREPRSGDPADSTGATRADGARRRRRVARSALRRRRRRRSAARASR